MKGWAWVPDFQPDDDGGIRLLELAAALGKVCRMGHADSLLVEPIVSSTAPAWEPFNRPEAIGSHNDFSTWVNRPAISLAWVRSVPADSECSGDWHVVSCSDVIASLDATYAGRRSLAILRQAELPFVFAPDEAAVRFRVLDAEASNRARFYGRALRTRVRRRSELASVGGDRGLGASRRYGRPPIDRYAWRTNGLRQLAVDA